MNVFEYAAKEEKIFEANFNGERQTTFYSDLSIAEFMGGFNAVKDTYRRILKSWLSNVEYFSEFVVCLNFKCWEHHERENQTLCALYNDLYHEANHLAYQTYKDKDLEYYFNMVD